MEWIKCSERMPDDGEYVIVATDDTTWVEAHFVEYDSFAERMMWFSSNGEADPRPISDFTHWMPLPEPPTD